MVTTARGHSVYIEGIEVKNCMSFNIAEGWIECFTTSPSKYCNQDTAADDFLRSRLYGHVEIYKDGK